MVDVFTTPEVADVVETTLAAPLEELHDTVSDNNSIPIANRAITARVVLGALLTPFDPAPTRTHWRFGL